MNTISAAPTPTGRLRQLISKLEPWYDWGTIYVERLEEIRVEDGRITTGGEGSVPYFVIQWLGLHLQVQIGRTPKREGC